MSNRSPDSHYRVYLEVLLREFDAIREASLAMEQRLSTIQTVAATVFAGAVVLMAKNGTSSIPYLLLAAPIVFGCFGLAMSYTGTLILMLAAYESQVLRPRIESLLRTHLKDEEMSAIEWQQFCLSSQWERGCLPAAVNAVQASGGGLFIIAACIVPLVVYTAEKGPQVSTWSCAERGLLVIDLVVIGLVLLAFSVSNAVYGWSRTYPYGTEQAARSPGWLHRVKDWIVR